MDPTAAVRTDALPAVATLVSPGALAAMPYGWLAIYQLESLRTFLLTHEGTGLALGVLAAIIVGFAIESAGSYVEVYSIDRRRPDHEEMLATWWRFLRTTYSAEPIGHRYLRRVLVSFKFELNMCVAVASSLPGILLLMWFGNLPPTAGWPWFIGSVLAMWLLFLAAKGSAGLLAELRARLIVVAP